MRRQEWRGNCAACVSLAYGNALGNLRRAKFVPLCASLRRILGGQQPHRHIGQLSGEWGFVAGEEEVLELKL